MIEEDKVKGALLGTAVGDALGMPVEGLSHQNVRTYYKGIKHYRDDEKREDLKAGQWTDDTQFTFALVRALSHALQHDGMAQPAVTASLAESYVKLRSEARRWGPTSRAAIERLAQGEDWERAGDESQPTNGAAMRAAPLGVWWATQAVGKEEAFDMMRPIFEVTHRHPASVVAGFGQAFAVRRALLTSPEEIDAGAFWMSIVEMTDWAERVFDNVDRTNSTRLRELADHLDDYPLDLRDLCGGVSANVDESWPFAVAMFVRNPQLIESTLLSAINVGGDADTTGAMLGALLGALHGWSAFPEEWRDELEDAARLEDDANTFYQLLAEFV